MEKLLICTFKKLNKLKKGQKFLKVGSEQHRTSRFTFTWFQENVNIQKDASIWLKLPHDTQNFTHLKKTEILTFISQTQHIPCCNLGFI